MSGDASSTCTVTEAMFSVKPRMPVSGREGVSARFPPVEFVPNGSARPKIHLVGFGDIDHFAGAWVAPGPGVASLDAERTEAAYFDPAALRQVPGDVIEYRIDRLADIGPEDALSEFLVDGRNQFRSCHGSLVLPL